MIEVVGLRKVFPNGHEALKDISFQVNPGECVAIVGRSGAGKSTLLRCLNGMVPVTSGSVVVNGVDVVRAGRDERRRLRRRIGFVYQEFNLIERLSVLDNVLVGRLGHAHPVLSALRLFPRADRERALANLERVHLLARAKQRADSLSGGEKQRVAIARAMAQEPVVLLADEPVASLDPELARGVMEDLRQIARADNVPTLINIHDVALARRYSDRLIGIARGEIVFDGPPEQLDTAALDRIYTQSGQPGQSGGNYRARRIGRAGPAGRFDRRRDQAGCRLMAVVRIGGVSDHVSATVRANPLAAPVPRPGLKGIAVAVAIGAVIVWAWNGTGITLSALIDGWPAMADFVSRLFPPDLSVARDAVQPLLQTIQMAIIGTLIATVLAVPLALLAAANISPHRWVYQSIRVFLNVGRTIPELVLALAFVAAVGLGTFPGTLALAVHSVFSLSKIFAETFESINPRPVEAVTAAGATRLQTITYAVIASSPAGDVELCPALLGAQHPGGNGVGACRGRRDRLRDPSLYASLPVRRPHDLRPDAHRGGHGDRPGQRLAALAHHVGTPLQTSARPAIRLVAPLGMRRADTTTVHDLSDRSYRMKDVLLTHALTRRSAVIKAAAGATALATVSAMGRRTAAQESTPAVEPSTGPTPSLKVALIPAEDSEEMLKQYQPLSDYLKSELEVEEFEIVPVLDYSAVIEAMRSSKVDLALFGPFSTSWPTRSPMPRRW